MLCDIFVLFGSLCSGETRFSHALIFTAVVSIFGGLLLMKLPGILRRLWASIQKNPTVQMFTFSMGGAVTLTPLLFGDGQPRNIRIIVTFLLVILGIAMMLAGGVAFERTSRKKPPTQPR